MMSTMVLSRKQSIFSPPSLSAGSAPEQVDRGRSIENENIVVMETKLKILEILQVGASGARSWQVGRVDRAVWGRGLRCTDTAVKRALSFGAFFAAASSS